MVSPNLGRSGSVVWQESLPEDVRVAIASFATTPLSYVKKRCGSRSQGRPSAALMRSASHSALLPANLLFVAISKDQDDPDTVRARQRALRLPAFSKSGIRPGIRALEILRSRIH